MLRCIHAYVVTESLHGMLRNKKEFLKRTNCPWVRNEHVPNEQRFIFFVWNGERFPLLLETNHAFRIVTQTYFNSEHAYDRVCVVRVFMVLLETKKEFLKLTKRPWVRNDYIPKEQRCIL